TGMNGTGTVIASIPAGAVIDQAGNLNLASTSTDHTVIFDNQPPTVTINQAAAQPHPPTANTIDFPARFSAPRTGLDGLDVSVADSTVGGPLVARVSGSGSTYPVTVSGMVGDGVVQASIPAGVAIDQANNSNLASSSTDNPVTWIDLPPSVT